MNDKLVKALNGAEVAIAPLCLDPLMARIAEQAGFSLGYISGGALGYSYAVSEALLTLTEIADATRRITQRCELGIIVDVGVGFGDPVHVARLVWELEQAGAVGVEIEDQVAPKRVSHHRGIEHLVSPRLMTQKIEQAAAARKNDDFKIIARTGAIKNEDYGHAVERLRAYREAGADVLMCMPDGDAQIKDLRETFDCPLSTITSMDQARGPGWAEAGWELIIDPFTAQVLAVQAVQTAYESFMRNGSSGTDLKSLFATYNQLDVLAGMQALYDIEDQTTERDSA